MWEKTPWFVGGGAEHSPELARLVLFASTAGAEGVVTHDSLKVRALGTPGGGVRIRPGAALMLNRSSGGAQQTYAARNPAEHEVGIGATSSSGRSDLVVARIEDPQYSPWPAPADVTTAQYVRTFVVTNVASSTTSAAQLNLGYPAIALARIDIPANTSSITDAMIKDVRRVAQSRRARRTLIATPTTSIAFPTTIGDVLAMGSVDVPEWATYMYLRGDLGGAVLRSATSNAEMRVRLGGEVTQTVAVTEEAGRRTNMLSAGRIYVAPHVRGGVRDVAIQARKSDTGTGAWSIDAYSTGVVDVEFVEEAA